MFKHFFNQLYQFVINHFVLKVFLYTWLIIYPFIFLYFYKSHGVNTIGYHTNLIIPLYIAVICNFFLSRTSKIKPILLNIRYFAIIYLFVELILIIIKPIGISNSTFHGQYLSPLRNFSPNYYHINAPHSTLRIETEEFIFEREINSLGLSDKEWNIEKPEEIFRIICLGDSFTEGDGVDYKNSYPSILQKDLQKKYKNIEVFNAGKRGSDPFFNYKYLIDTLIAYRPDIIIQSFTTNDYYLDMVLRGGMDRFGKDGKLIYRHHHWWEPIYASSFVARIFFKIVGGFNQFLIKESEYPQIMKEITFQTINLFKDYKQLIDEKEVKLIVFTMPFIEDFKNKGNESFYNLFLPKFTQLQIPFYNLQPCYNDYAQSHQSQVKDYYWEKDGHHNAKGYEMMAKCIEEIVYNEMNK